MLVAARVGTAAVVLVIVGAALVLTALGHVYL